jgi:glycosyltransferase involved in cell wall biosynthesis
MSCQLPVIASNIPEIRTNFESIVNYNLGDPANLAHQIIELIQNNKLQSTGADCRKEVKLKYSLEKMVSSYHNYLWA